MARSDMFLKATGQRTGAIVGESNDKNFQNQIDIADWSWGMTAPSTTSGQRTGRTSLESLKIVKRVDSASTSLMAVLDRNEMLSTAVITVRKSGGAGQSLVYLLVTLEEARIVGYSVHSSVGDDGAPVLMEHLSFTFKSIRLTYTPQSGTGGAVGTSEWMGHAGPT
jgi:type VI secretion system secreted protein Hcp